MGLGNPIDSAQHRSSAPASGAKQISSRAPSTRTQLFEYVDSLAEDGAWPVDLDRRFLELPLKVSATSSSATARCAWSRTRSNREIYRLLGNRADGETIGADQY